MAKDPAFLFYPGDWLGGTLTFSRAHKGAYMDVLMAQFNIGHLSLQDIKDVLGQDFDGMWESKLSAKFKIDANGCYYNEKLDGEISKRRKYTESRRNNLLHMNKHMGAHVEPHMSKHMENENVNEDVDINKERECEGEKDFPFSSDPKFKELWDAFVEMRKSCRAKPTKKAVELIMKKLHAQSLEDACAMLEQSIENNWKSVYPLKDGKDGKHNKTDNKRIATSFEGKNYNEGAF